MASRPRVLVCCDYFLPGFKGGGPITTLRNLLARLGDEIDFHVVTRDRDLGDERAYDAIAPHVWQRIEGGQVLYLPEADASVATFARLIADIAPDTVYLNSVLSRRFSLFPLLAAQAARPVPRIILAPRGEFSPGALALKPWQKKAYFSVMRLSGRWRRITWQASSLFEAANIGRVAGQNAAIATAADLSGQLPAAAPRPAKQPGQAQIVFLGRISPMKNLDGAVAMLASARGQVDFCVYGPIEDTAYWTQCLDAARALPPGIVMRHAGEVRPDMVPDLLGRADAMFLPSHGENFGHVVAEALGAGCPVILSDRTPWRNLQAAGVGWDLPLDQKQAFAAAIQQIVDMGDNEHATLRANARRYAEDIGADPAQMDANRALFLTR